MKYVVDVNGTRVVVELDGASATIEGEGYDVALTPSDGTPVRLVRIGDEVHRVLARRGDARGRWLLDVDGTRFETEALDERLRTIRDLTAAAEVRSGPAPLLAPMPGLVVRVSVRPGDVVSAGQGLVVMEAMKMENELCASAAGVVLAVKVEAGVAVNKGALLVELGAPPA
ncbi:MAG: biotin/lipoyl-containing protein [Gemmatimonas sp.]